MNVRRTKIEKGCVASGEWQVASGEWWVKGTFRCKIESCASHILQQREMEMKKAKNYTGASI